MADKSVKPSATGRYVVVIDPSKASTEAVAHALETRKLKVEDRLDFINTLVVSGEAEQAEKAQAEVEGVQSVEPEGVMTAQ